MSPVSAPPSARTGRIAALRARRALERDYAALRTTTLQALAAKLRRTSIQMDPSDLEAAYNLAWHALYSKLSAGEHVENPGGFLVQAAYFRVVDEYRARHPDRHQDTDPDRVGATEGDLDARLDDAQLLRVFSQGLKARLNERECRAAVLCYLHGYSRGEAAQALDIAPARMEKIMDRVSKVVRGLVDDLRDGSWCEDQKSMMTAYALGVLELDGPRHRLASEHLETCSGCRAYVRRLRGIGAIVPPIALPWGAVGLGPFDVPGIVGHGTTAPPAGSTGPRSRRPKRSQLVAGGSAAVVALVVAALAAGGDDGARRAGGTSAPSAAAGDAAGGTEAAGGGASASADAAARARAEAAASRAAARRERVAAERAATRERARDRRRARAAARRRAERAAAATARAVPAATPAPSTAPPAPVTPAPATPAAPAPQATPPAPPPAASPSPAPEREREPEPLVTDAEQEFGVEP
ncbi:sigma-70 family RNA polymerase sigma factor [Patulibacter americanus]|uniref:sigma-70 family RNA polymerase sigma factor n=1 Tax=Patulibacter americanus TaxID=588672 RepID=UPI0003B70BF0|nr:sigma-70 family RNA polymerase sigma factor [Patulibacter americanus]